MAGAEAVWTGREALFLETYDEDEPITGQTYDPRARSWRRIEPAPLSGGYGGIRVWTGAELIVWGGGDRGADRTLEGAAYDPAADVWRWIADAPIGLNLASGVWTGREVVVFGSLLSRANRAPTPTSVGAAYDPSEDRWRTIPPSALSPQASSAVWIDDRLVAWDYETTSQEYDPESDQWSAPINMPIPFSECYPESTAISRLVFAWFCGDAALYDESHDAWQRLDGGPLDKTVYSTAYRRDVDVWRFAELLAAGSVVVMPMEGITLNRRGVACYGCEGSPTSLWVYRPPTVFAPEELADEPRKGAVRRAVPSLMYAWSADVEGKLPWLVTEEGLASFEDRLPPRWRGAFRMGRVRDLGGGSFEMTVLLPVRKAGRQDVPVRSLTLVFGPGVSLGGEPMSLVLTAVRG